MWVLELSTNTLSSGVDDEISIDFGRNELEKYSARISGYISNFSTYDGGLKFYTSSGGTLNTTPQLTISSKGTVQQGNHNWSFDVSKTYYSNFDMFDVECDVGDFAACTVKIAGSKRSPGSNDHVGIKEYSCFKVSGANNWVVLEETGRGSNNDITFQVSTTKVTFISPFAGNNNFCYYSVTVIGTARSASNKSDLRVISYGD